MDPPDRPPQGAPGSSSTNTSPKQVMIPSIFSGNQSPSNSAPPKSPGTPQVPKTPRHNEACSASPEAHRGLPRRSQRPASGMSIQWEQTRTADLGDRVFPIRSVVSVDPTPSSLPRDSGDYFAMNPTSRSSSHAFSPPPSSRQSFSAQQRAAERATAESTEPTTPGPGRRRGLDRLSSSDRIPTSSFPQGYTALLSDRISEKSSAPSNLGRSGSPTKSMVSGMSADDSTLIITARFKHVVSEGGHAVITGRDGETLQRCEDEPIHIPGAVQAFGALVALHEEEEGKLVVRVASENAKRIIGYSPRHLFELNNFLDILSEEQGDNLLDHIDFVRDDATDVEANGPEVFTMTIRDEYRMSHKLWCAVHINIANPSIIICEFELEDDKENPLVPSMSETPEPPEDTLSSAPTEDELRESTETHSRPLRILRSARKRKGEAAAMEVFNIMSQVQEQLAQAPNLDQFLRVLVGVVKELTGFHRVMIYQFDHAFNGKVVTELVDPRATKDLYKGLNFPASDIPRQAREMYKINKVRLLYDREQETARLVCRTLEDLETPLDLTHSYLRAMSPIHIKYLNNMAVRSSMSISINAFDELWGLISCHAYGNKGTRVSFPIRKMCRLVGDSASRNIERLSYASRLHARKLINTSSTEKNPSGYIIASSDDLLSLFDADYGLLSIRDETKILGKLEATQEALALLEYLRMRQFTSVITSQEIRFDFQDLRYPPGFKAIAGLLLVPLSVGGQDFIVFFRKGQLKEVKWAGNPYEKFVKAGTEGFLEPRKSFKMWRETVIGKCREWTEEQTETAGVLCLVYGKFIEVWRQKEAAMQNTHLTKLLLQNSAHEVRTPLNAIINYLEIALEGSLDSETRDNLAKSHSASKSLIYVINDLLDLTKTEQSTQLVHEEVFNVSQVYHEAVDKFNGDAKRKNIEFHVNESPNLPVQVIGDPRRVRQAISNVTANAIEATSQGFVKADIYVVERYEKSVNIEVAIEDSGAGMSSQRLDDLFAELEQVQHEATSFLDTALAPPKQIGGPDAKSKQALGLGLAVVARIIRNMDGQLRLKSEEGKGSRFVMVFPFELPASEAQSQLPTAGDSALDLPSQSHEGEVTLVAKASTGAEGRPTTLSRNNSGGSFDSLMSARSMSSNVSARSDVDRLIEAIQEPIMERSLSTDSGNRRNRRTRKSRSAASRSLGARDMARPQTSQVSPSSPTSAMSLPTSFAHSGPTPGSIAVTDSGTPLHAIRVPDEGSSELDVEMPHSPSTVASTLPMSPGEGENQMFGLSLAAGLGFPSADKLNVLVAEDDPINSRIIQKRLEKSGHATYLTVNGGECSSQFGERSGFFDIILMDMQMPIVDGMTAAKMIRSFEKTQPAYALSERASLNGRIPIFAVSASLVERELQEYIDAGFDGWILKPISFSRLSELFLGLVSPDIRRVNLYKPGGWEHGGWFGEAAPAPEAAPARDDARPESDAETTPAARPDAESDRLGAVTAAQDHDTQPQAQGTSTHPGAAQAQSAANTSLPHGGATDQSPPKGATRDQLWVDPQARGV